MLTADGASGIPHKPLHFHVRPSQALTAAEALAHILSHMELRALFTAPPQDLAYLKLNKLSETEIGDLLHLPAKLTAMNS